MSPPKPKAAVDLVEEINAIIGQAVRENGGTDHGAFYKEVAQIISRFEAYQEDIDERVRASYQRRS